MVLLLTAAAIVRKISSISRKLIAKAKEYVGIKEKGSNGGWENSTFEKKMKSVGWYSGAEWCNFFVKMVVLELAKGKAKDFFEKALTGSTQQTWKNLQTPSKYHEVLQQPCKGALMIYQNLSDTSHGHIEIFVSGNPDKEFYVISGNSAFENGQGQGVAYKKRNGCMKGFKILGYIKIKKLR
ncbi:MAG: hypothetical protein K5685_06530 [Bacteroidales bacterium]|nr:hypothetical protein [Bacteroidales bacterium]